MCHYTLWFERLTRRKTEDCHQYQNMLERWIMQIMLSLLLRCDIVVLAGDILCSSSFDDVSEWMGAG